MASAEQVGSDLSVPPSFDRIGYSEAPDPERAENVGNPHRALLLAVIERALADARNPTSSGLSGTAAAGYWDRVEAIAFLTAERGARAVWRRTLLGLVGIDFEGFARMVAEERARWPKLSPQPKHGGRGPAVSTRRAYASEEERQEARERALANDPPPGRSGPPRREQESPQDEAALARRRAWRRPAYQAERRREQSRQCMANKRARERAEREAALKPAEPAAPKPTPSESYSRRALLAGSSVTFPAFRDR